MPSTTTSGGGGGAESTGDAGADQVIDELRRQLREKDMALTDIRLEALSSAHQLEALKETVARMRVRLLGIWLNISQLGGPCIYLALLFQSSEQLGGNYGRSIHWNASLVLGIIFRQSFLRSHSFTQF